MNTVFTLLAFYATTWAIKEASLFDKPRVWLIGRSKFFASLLSCYFCCGFYSGVFVYGLANPVHSWDLFQAILWGLASSATSFLLNLIADRLLFGQT